MPPQQNNSFANLSLPAAAARIAAARTAKAAHVAQLFKLPNIVAIGVGFRNRDRQGLRELCLVCSVDRKRPLNELRESDRAPAYLGDFRVDVVASGKFRALGQPQVERMRPVQPGISIGHTGITAGTFGCVVLRNGERLLLSNNHVIANGNAGKLGDSIVQPGPHDGGSSQRDVIAKLVEYIPIVYDGDRDPVGATRTDPNASGCGKNLSFLAGKTNALDPINRAGQNLVDCAIARPVDPSILTTDILNVGRPRGIGVGALGMRVQKSGRTTGHTLGDIEQIDVTSRIEYETRSATFSGQIMATAVSAGGDSGSVVLDMSNNVIGLLFAGSQTSTLINPIQNVFEALNIELAL